MQPKWSSMNGILVGGKARKKARTATLDWLGCRGHGIKIIKKTDCIKAVSGLFEL